MDKVAMIYWSGTGHTQEMANAIANGLREAGAECDLFDAGSTPINTLPAYGKLALGCPACGEEQLDQAVFAPVFEAIKPLLAGRKVALFGSYGWGGGEWMRRWAEETLSAGAVMPIDPFIMRNAPHAEECATFGKAFAEC